MILITSAAYINPGLASEFGKLPPCMLPVQNKRLYEHQACLFPKEKIVLSLPNNYSLSTFDQRNLNMLGISVCMVPIGCSLGESIIYVLNVESKYNEPLYLLHGDTLFSKVSKDLDIAYVANAKDNYDWGYIENEKNLVYAGFFSFSNQSLLIRKITENSYDFLSGVKEYSKEMNSNEILRDDWMDFSLPNSYYRSISKLTTQRIFNSLKINRYSLIKSSKDNAKMMAESNWLSSVPKSIKHYVPSVFDKGVVDDQAFYEIEYYYFSSLASIFVFGQNSFFILKDIVYACLEYLNDEAAIKPLQKEIISKQNNLLYTNKTKERLKQYQQQSGISLDSPWIINGIKTPSLNTIIEETDKSIKKDAEEFVSLMHGDFCFSNILYDFKSRSIKLIDPRGIDIEGNLSIYGDIRYDVAKFAHSVLGLYDFIISGMFSYSENSENNLQFNIESTLNIKEIQKEFLKSKIAGYSLEELDTYPILIHLFLSMIPLHSDKPLRQKAMLANALRLYIDYSLESNTKKLL